MHAGLVIAAALCAFLSLNLAIWASSETCRTQSDRFQCSEFPHTIGLVGLVGALLVLIILLVYAVARFLAWILAGHRDPGDKGLDR